MDHLGEMPVLRASGNSQTDDERDLEPAPGKIYLWLKFPLSRMHGVMKLTPEFSKTGGGNHGDRE